MRTPSRISSLLNGRIESAAVLAGSLFAAMFLFAGCCDECETPAAVDYPPAAPMGVYSITGNGWVEVHWNANTEPTLAGYDIYWDYSENIDESDYWFSVPRHQTYFVDRQVENGVTYFYAIRAYDAAGRVSPLSAIVYDTPRPAGTGLILYNYLGPKSDLSGYDFSARLVQPWTADTTDVYFGYLNRVPTLFGKGQRVGQGVDVQDFGFIDLIWVDVAPDVEEGWSPTKRVELIPGHSYVVQILDASRDYFYAKVYCQAVTDEFVVLDWAFQEDPNNPELAPERGGQQ